MDENVIATFDQSLRRCDNEPRFLDIFYDRFLASSPKVKEKFANTDFAKQKRLLRASFYLIVLAAEDPDKGPERYLQYLAERHSAKNLNVGSELYDLWLDSLLETVEECDPEYSPEVAQAWEQMMEIGIDYMLQHFHRR